MSNYQQQRVNLAEQVYGEIRKRIIDGTYPTGMQITELFVSKELSVSRTPVREAMKQLEAEGLIELRPNRGAVVLGIHSSDIEDIYEIRSLLEGRAAEKAALNATDEDVDQLTEILDLTEFYIERGNYEKVTAMDDRFHGFLYQLTDSRILQKILSDLHAYAEHIRERSITSPGRAKLMLEEHRSVVAAIRAHDKEEAGKRMLYHIQNSAKNMEKNHLI